MRLTCLRCGHQVELTTSEGAASGTCICGQDYVYPRVIDTGIRPNKRAAERSRYRAFRAAGLVKNVGGFALGIAFLGILCPPMALAGAVIGVYVLTMLRGPVGRYSGRAAAAWAVAIGVVVSVAETAFLLSWWEERHLAEIAAIQETASEDLRALLRAERLHYASNDHYGLFHDFSFQPPYGQYTLYLSQDDFTPATRDGQRITDPLPKGFEPAVSREGFTAVAVANLDSDADLDVWVLGVNGRITHAQNDANGP